VVRFELTLAALFAGVVGLAAGVTQRQTLSPTPPNAGT